MTPEELKAYLKPCTVSFPFLSDSSWHHRDRETLPGHHWSYIGRVSGMSQSRWCHGQSDRNGKITVNLATCGRNIKTWVLKVLGLKTVLRRLNAKPVSETTVEDAEIKENLERKLISLNVNKYN